MTTQLPIDADFIAKSNAPRLAALDPKGVFANFVDPMTGKKKWSVRDDYPRISTVLSTKGGLVFSGDMKGNLYAYDADNGNQVWKFNMGSACRGG